MTGTTQTRRGFLTRPASASAPASASRSASTSERDLAALRVLLRVEQASAAACQAILGRAVLAPAATAVVQTVLRDERAHVRTLERELAARSVAASDARTAAAAPGRPVPLPVLDDAIRGVSGVRTRAQAIDALLGLEAVSTGAYRLALGRLADAALVGLAAQILADEAQHATALRLLADHQSVSRAVPETFVSGRRWAPEGGW